MADEFFAGGTMPPKFNHAAAIDQEPKAPDEPQLRYNPPELVLGGSSVPQIHEVAREELDGPAQDAIQAAQDRMQQGQSEQGEPIVKRSGWSQEDIRSVEQEDRDRGLELEPTWNEQVQREYDRWALDTLAAQHDDKWGEKEAMEHAEDFQHRMHQSQEVASEHNDIGHEH